MRKIFLFNLITLDGYFEGPNHDISWHMVDEDFNKFAIEQLNDIGTIIFGRVTYEMMASFWPTDLAKDDPETAKLMNEASKIVVSTTLEKADWQNTRLIKDNVKNELQRLKESNGKDIAIFGSSKLAVSLIEMGLLDEIRVIVNPIILGEGTTLLKGIKNKVNLKLTKSQTFGNGNVMMFYSVQK